LKLPQVDFTGSASAPHGTKGQQGAELTQAFSSALLEAQNPIILVMFSKGNYPKIAELLRLVNYCCKFSQNEFQEGDPNKTYSSN